MDKARIKKAARNALIIISVIALSIWLWRGNTAIQLTYVRIIDEKIPDEFEGFTILHISDLHNAEFGKKQERLLKAIKGTSADMIAITGDLIDSNHTDIEKAMDFIDGAVELAPVYYVSGNHEAWSEHYLALKKQLLIAGVKILGDEGIEIKRNEASITLLGINDPDFMSGLDMYETHAFVGSILKNLTVEGSKYRILLSHRPELLDVYADNNINLVLCGHAHGGQFRLPFIGGLVAPNQGFFPKYYEGVYQKEQTKMIVSRGLGNSIIPLRINNRPELVIVKLSGQPKG